MLFCPLVILISLMIIHLLEEILTGFRKKFPLGQMPLWFFISANILIYAFAGVMLYMAITNKPGANVMAWIFTTGVFLNGLGHTFIMLVKKKYFPGGWTAVPLIIMGIITMIILLNL